MKIVEVQLQRVAKRLQQQHLQLELDKPAKALIAKEGYDPQFGARPLKRSIQEHLLDPLATQLLEGRFQPGDHIKATAQDGQLIFEKN
jgi:ATP-dependent Clp protease ATP-binding subunit ClpB